MTRSWIVSSLSCAALLVAGLALLGSRKSDGQDNQNGQNTQVTVIFSKNNVSVPVSNSAPVTFASFGSFDASNYKRIRLMASAGPSVGNATFDVFIVGSNGPVSSILASTGGFNALPNGQPAGTGATTLADVAGGTVTIYGVASSSDGKDTAVLGSVVVYGSN